MKAVFFHGKDFPLLVKETYKPIPSARQVLIKLQYAAINRRDNWIVGEQATHFKDGIILGSDGSGVVESIGESADQHWVGKQVIVNPSYNWGNNPNVQADSFKILGFPDAGTFAEYIAVPQDHVFEKPVHLSMAEAAALPLSGLTAYRSLFSKARLRPNEKVLVTGAGGSTGYWALKLALAFNATVFVTAGSGDKIKKSIDAGATGGFNYNDPSWITNAQKAGGFDIIVDGAAGPQFGQLLELARPGGRVVLYGRTTGNIEGIIPRSIFFKQLSIFGTMMGTRDEFLSLLDFVEKHQLRPAIDREFPLADTPAALEYAVRGSRFGKVLLNIESK